MRTLQSNWKLCQAPLRCHLLFSWLSYLNQPLEVAQTLEAKFLKLRAYLSTSGRSRLSRYMVPYFIFPLFSCSFFVVEFLLHEMQLHSMVINAICDEWERRQPLQKNAVSTCPRGQGLWESRGEALWRTWAAGFLRPGFCETLSWAFVGNFPLNY